MIGALELVANKETREAFDPTDKIGMECLDNCHRHGLIVRAIGDNMALCPPLIATESDVDEIFDRLGKALDNTLDSVRNKGLITE